MLDFKDENPGNRKVILTKWMLIIFSLGTLGYFVVLGIKGESPPDSFYMNFVLGLGAIGGAFTAGNIFEHWGKSQENIEKDKAEKEKSKVEKIKHEAEKAKADAKKAAEETKKAKVEAETAKNASAR